MFPTTNLFFFLMGQPGGYRLFCRSADLPICPDWCPHQMFFEEYGLHLDEAKREPRMGGKESEQHNIYHQHWHR